jgi:hypothetical protein
MIRNIHFSPDAADSAGAKQTAKLATENEKLRERLAQAEEALDMRSKEEGAIRKRMAAGLTREQAEAAVSHQRHYEKAMEESKKAK